MYDSVVYAGYRIPNIILATQGVHMLGVEEEVLCGPMLTVYT